MKTYNLNGTKAYDPGTGKEAWACPSGMKCDHIIRQEACSGKKRTETSINLGSSPNFDLEGQGFSLEHLKIEYQIYLFDRLCWHSCWSDLGELESYETLYFQNIGRLATSKKRNLTNSSGRIRESEAFGTTHCVPRPILRVIIDESNSLPVTLYS